jgi:hypothetical protein
VSQFEQIWDDLLKISQGNASVFERTTSLFEKRDGSLYTSYNPPYGRDAASGDASPASISGPQR